MHPYRTISVDISNSVYSDRVMKKNMRQSNLTHILI